MKQVRCWRVFDDLGALQSHAAALVLRHAREAIAARGVFRIVLAGGETPRALYQRLATAEAAWADWQIYFGDERCLPAKDPARNSHMAQTTWLDHVAIPRDQIYPIPAERGAEKAAHDYTETIRGVTPFDLVLLGLGEDGHTASLFPGQHWSGAPVLAIHDAPKPPPARVSLSAESLSATRHAMVLVTGTAKRQAVARWRASEAIPAAVIAPAAGIKILVEMSAWPGGRRPAS